jgi:hypothetical protein
MARFSAFLGRRVDVQYRAGDILLPASGTFVADSGRSIFLEQTLVQRGQHKHFRWEIPYQCIIRIEEKPDPATAAVASGAPQAGPAPAQASSPEPAADAGALGSTRAAGASGSASPMLPIRNRPKTA